MGPISINTRALGIAVFLKMLRFDNGMKRICFLAVVRVFFGLLHRSSIRSWLINCRTSILRQYGIGFTGYVCVYGLCNLRLYFGSVALLYGELVSSGIVPVLCVRAVCRWRVE